MDSVLVFTVSRQGEFVRVSASSRLTPTADSDYSVYQHLTTAEALSVIESELFRVFGTQLSLF